MDSEAASFSTFQSLQSELESSQLSGLFMDRPTSADYVDRKEKQLLHICFVEKSTDA